MTKDLAPFEAQLDSERLGDALALRVRRRGDVFLPLGLHGHSQKLSDFFVNEKLPARARDRWPLLCTDDAIAWIPGFRPAERYKRRGQTRRVVRLKVSRSL
jgi:tRNA(Ile)-lysidine synthase